MARAKLKERKLRYNFKSDLLFKMLFAKNQHLLKRLIAVILKISLDSIVDFIVTNAEIVPEEIGTKFCRIDIRMKINGEPVNLEIQALNRGNYPERTLYYWAREFSGALLVGQDYINLPKVIIISIIDFRLFQGESVHSEFMVMEVNSHEILTNKLCLHYFELPKLGNIDVNDELSLWLALFDAETEEELETLLNTGVDFVEQAVQEYRIITADKKFRELERIREMRLHDEASALGYVRRKATKEANAKWENILASRLSEKDAAISEKDAAISEKDATISEKDAEIALLRSQLEQLNNYKN